MIRAISGITYSNGVMIVDFAEAGVPNEEWNLAHAAVPINSLIQAPFDGDDVVDPEQARGHQMVICLFTDPSNNITTKFVVDVRDINEGNDYATPQDLIDEITANIPNGGGGGGVASVLADAPLNSSGGANPTISIDTTGANPGDVLTFVDPAVEFSPPAGAFGPVNGQAGPQVTLQIPLDIPYANVATGATPAAGQVKVNNADYTLATQLVINEVSGDAFATNHGATIEQMRVGGLIYIKQIDAGDLYTPLPVLVYRVTSVPVLASTNYTIGVAYVSGGVPNPVPLWYMSYAGNGVGVYKAVLTQTGTDAPTVGTGFTNSIDATLAWSYVNVGRYDLVGPANTFPEGTTSVISNGGVAVFVSAIRLDDATIRVATRNPSDVLTDGLLNEASIHVELPG